MFIVKLTIGITAGLVTIIAAGRAIGTVTKLVTKAFDAVDNEIDNCDKKYNDK